MMNNFNAEDYRQPWESDSQWELKKEFIEMYKYILDEEQLSCLAQAYCDMVLKNSRFPESVEKVIIELSKPLRVCKQFQENDGNPSVKRSINEHHKDPEKISPEYKHSERPFKQMKLLVNEENSNSSVLSTPTSVQPPVEHFKNTYPVFLYNQQGTEIFSKSNKVLKATVEHYETSSKQTKFSTTVGETNSVFLSTLSDRLQPSMKQFNNTYSESLYNDYRFYGLPISVKTFKASVDCCEISMKEKNDCNNGRQHNSTLLSTSTDVFFPVKEQFQNKSSTALSKEQDVQTFSKSEQAFRTSELERSERSFKEMEFSINKEQSTSTFLPSSTDVLQHSVEQFKNIYSCSEEDSPSFSESEQTFKKSTENSERPHNKPFSATKELLSSTLLPAPTDELQSSEERFKNTHSTSFNDEGAQNLSESKEAVDVKAEPFFQIKDISIEKEREDMIIKTLGLPFIKNFAELVKKCVDKNSDPVNMLHYVTSKCKVKDEYHIVILEDPDIPTKFSTKFFLKNCLITSFEICTFKKKKVKPLCITAAISILVKLATGGTNSSTSISVKKPLVHGIIDNREIFEIFSRNIRNRKKDEPAIVTLKNIASLEDMEDYVIFNVTSDIISETETEYTCKFFLNDILVSHAIDNVMQSAKIVAAELGIIKLTNLAEYEIHEGELKKIISHKRKSNKLKKPFILNEVLFKSSMRDEMVCSQRGEFRIHIQNDVRNVIFHSLPIREERFTHLAEAIPGPDDTTYKKTCILFGGKEVGVGVAFRVADSKTVACAKACINLKKKYYTLRVKDEHAQGFFVTPDQVYNNEKYYKNVLERDIIISRKQIPRNVVSHIEILKKELLNCVKGVSSTATGSQPKVKSKDLFRAHLKKMLVKFRESEDYCDLLFSNKFTHTEKVEIIKMAKMNGLHALKMMSTNGVFVCVTHKYDVRKLLKYLVRKGGSNCKFEMLDESVTVI